MGVGFLRRKDVVSRIKIFWSAFVKWLLVWLSLLKRG